MPAFANTIVSPYSHLPIRVETLETENRTLKSELVSLREQKTDRELESAKKEAKAHAQLIANAVACLSEGMADVESKEMEVQAQRSEENAVRTSEEELRFLNKRALLLKEKLTVTDTLLARLNTLFAVRKDTTAHSAGSDAKGMETGPSSLDEEAGIKKMIKGIGLNSVRVVNLSNSAQISSELLQSLAQALKVRHGSMVFCIVNDCVGEHYRSDSKLLSYKNR